MLTTQLFGANRKKSYILARVHNNSYSIVRQENTGGDAPIGSLLKPFAALYLLEKGQNPHSRIFCPPERNRKKDLRCWTPEGHGAVNLVAALIHSCNYYFLSLFAGRELADYESWLMRRFDWPNDLPIRKPVHVYGFDLERGLHAESLLKMYLLLLKAADDGDRNAMAVRNALAEICRGTLLDLCRKMRDLREFRILLGKTGTVQQGKAPYGIALLVLEHLPRKEKILLICYARDKTGSGAAMAAPAILRRYANENRQAKNIGS